MKITALSETDDLLIRFMLTNEYIKTEISSMVIRCYNNITAYIYTRGTGKINRDDPPTDLLYGRNDRCIYNMRIYIPCTLHIQSYSSDKNIYSYNIYVRYVYINHYSSFMRHYIIFIIYMILSRTADKQRRLASSIYNIIIN